jgi:hypothetical protein
MNKSTFEINAGNCRSPIIPRNAVASANLAARISTPGVQMQAANPDRAFVGAFGLRNIQRIRNAASSGRFTSIMAPWKV